MATVQQNVPDNFNALYDMPTRAARGVAAASVAPRVGHSAAVARMAGAVPELVVDYDEATQNPVLVTTRSPTGRLAATAAGSPDAAAQRFVQDRADLWQLDSQDA